MKNRISVGFAHQCEAALICNELTHGLEHVQISVTADRQSACWQVVLSKDGTTMSFIVDGVDLCSQLRSKLQEHLQTAGGRDVSVCARENVEAMTKFIEEFRREGDG